MAQQWIRDLPNQLSLCRIATTPILLFIFPLPYDFSRFFCVGLFILAAVTDALDGFIARRFKAESALGALLDPMADKLLTTSVLVLLVYTGALWPWMSGLLLCRDVAMSGVRQIASDQGIQIPVSLMGKWKTLFLDVALLCLMIDRPLFGVPFRELGMVSIWIALILSCGSAWVYVVEYWDAVKRQSQYKK
ncbi:MAG: CDP-diacylglycerol--glycerol-3-phosphate 3-phosphatidyltransferase [Oligoflexales bacterium]